MDQAAKGRSSAVYAIGTDPVRMRAILEHHLQVPDGPPFEVVDCRPSFTRGREARSLFQYDVELTRRGRARMERTRERRCLWGAADAKGMEKLKPADEDGPGELSIRRAAYVPDLDLILQVFPFDHGLPALEPLMTGTLAGLTAPIMGRFGSGEWLLDEWQSESVRYRVDLRASVKLTIRAIESRSGSVSERRFFAKVYGGKDQAERAWTVQQDLAVAVRAASAPFGLAPLVAYLPEARVLVQDEVQALSLPHIIRRADPETVAEAVRRAARGIAALHRLSITAPEHRIELDRTDPARLRRTADVLRNSRPISHLWWPRSRGRLMSGSTPSASCLPCRFTVT